MDDNKLLTLANGDRLDMTENVRLLFEVMDLRNASPATVSRAGIIFVSSTDLGYGPLFTAWLNKRNENEQQILQLLYDKYVIQPDTFEFLQRNTRNVMPVSTQHLVTNLLCLLECLLHEAHEKQTDYPPEALERLFLYAMAWSLGALLEHDDRSVSLPRLIDRQQLTHHITGCGFINS